MVDWTDVGTCGTGVLVPQRQATGDWGLGTGDWGLGAGDSSHRPIVLEMMLRWMSDVPAPMTPSLDSRKCRCRSYSIV